MARTALPDVAGELGRDAGPPRRATRLVRGSMEAVVLAMVCLAPWAFGAVAPEHQFLLDVGVAILMILWGARMLLEGRFSWRKCPVAVCLAACVLVGLWQLTPLTRGLLARISPATARMYDRLLPSRPEVLPSGEPAGVSTPPTGSTLSLYPGSTRRELAGYLGILLLFAAVRQNVASSASLRRLAVAAFVNGSLLALFGVVQALSAEPETIYWIYPAPGATGVFGPFINRNHFAFYLNVCLGLGAGLLLGRYPSRNGMPEAGGATPAGAVTVPARGGLGDRMLPTLDPPALGMVFALALMISGVVYSLSRGGFLALLGGSILGLAVRPPRSRASCQGRVILLTVAAVLGLVSWIGYDRVVARLGTLKGDMMGRDGRWAIWSRALPLLPEFPLWGTGLGTYQYVDVLHRSDASVAGFIVDHAHNDYLEALVEGGLALLLPVVLAVVLVFRSGLRAVGRHRDRPVGGLVLGALMGLTAAAIHSFSDFGMHMPANAAIATVVCAQLCAAGRRRGGAGPQHEPGRESDDDSDGYILRLGGLAPILGGMAVVALGLVLAGEGWRARRAQQLRLVAFERDASGDPAVRAQKVAALEAAARLVPGYARLQADLAHAHLTALAEGIEGSAGSGPATAGTGPGSIPALAGPGRTDNQPLILKHLVPALRHLLRSRDACPLRAEAHMEIAERVHEFEEAEPRAAYLERAKFLAPDDPGLWERCGDLELRDGRPDQAWMSWRRSLELSDSHLPRILARCAELLGPHEILRRVLPDRPDLLLEAALELYPRPGEGRRPFLERALALLEERLAPLGAADLHLKASLHRALGQPAEALAAYQAALDREPLELAWRFELAELFYERGRFQDAFQELLKIRMMQPGNDRARVLLDAVKEKIAEGK